MLLNMPIPTTTGWRSREHRENPELRLGVPGITSPQFKDEGIGLDNPGHVQYGR